MVIEKSTRDLLSLFVSILAQDILAGCEMYLIKIMARIKPVFVTTWVIASLISSTAPSLAQLDEPSNPNSDSIQIRFILANPPLPDKGTPQTNRGTGTRGDCLSKPEKPPLTHLAGEKNFELTVSERPTFWAYVPYTPEEAPSGEFFLQDGEDNVYRTQFQLPATPGIVSISLPSTAKPLEVGKTYRWYFDINCPTSDSANKITPASMTGVVQRISPSVELEQELKAAKTPLKRIAAYAKHSIWHETLTELVQLRLNEPQNSLVERLWVELLSDETIGFKNIAPEPIAGSVITSSPPE
jgi:hypothetical protein